MSNEEIEKPDLEQDNINDSEENVQPEVEQSTEKLLEDARSKADEHWNELLLARADLENMRRRHARDLESAHKHALDKFVNELLPICDSLELGLSAANGEEATLETVREGMEMTLKMLLSNIGKLGLEQVNPEGQAFDPELHQAVSMQPSEGIEANQVITVMQKGYSFNGRLLRPAMVVVSQ
ncbi:Heat shock protein GrpE [Methylophaga thiooxydans]|uniref:Protein GrpE n=2 Tax=Methylophaga thiooxydans TaxID=392484 RepID=C0N5R8_9GAMM|nr:nucleotide exchange factor GrpE [Methylophaga thiooxydans]EEF79966.1 co-chaperone GrpE [Methylophaga thiooxydans DMS010]KGM08029.1 Heat shock protein GrpE [Methylophaga thiooxydans]|mmetsp:Transcript_16651/g.21432  ORF Transcript_16651/g.21432 Transcript_16651/m.21432 type:complete len:182 (-) Transcript_16651:2536-3081(-)